VSKIKYNWSYTLRFRFVNCS